MSIGLLPTPKAIPNVIKFKGANLETAIKMATENRRKPGVSGRQGRRPYEKNEIQM